MQRLGGGRAVLLSAVSVAIGAGLGAGLMGWQCWGDSKPRLGSVQAATEVAPSAALMKYGFPGGLSQMRSREGYMLAYDPRLRGAAWVIERLDTERLEGSSTRKACEFREDDTVHAYHRANNADFRGSGLDRGHLAAAGNHKCSQKAMDETFYLSNVAPQDPNLNQNAWNNLEKYCRSLTRHNKSVYVCTGPLFLPRMEADGKMYVKYQVIGKNNVAVPTHFFKIVLLEKPSGELELRPYVMPNSPVDEKIPLERFLVPIESIERASGLLFVPNIMKRTNSLKAISAGSR